MARTSSFSSTTPTSESNIAFFAAGGHNHDGQNSSLIDASKYSIFDFDQGLIPTNSERAQAQQRNKINFEDNIKDILRTAGIELSANSINATQIIAGSITSEEIAANTITAQNIAANTITANNLAADAIQSSNLDLTNLVLYTQPFSDDGSFFDLSSGSIITPAFAVYPAISRAYIKGTVDAESGYIGNENYGFDITSTSTSATMSSIDFATGGGSRGKLFLHSYGDIDIYSSPVSGPHNGQNWVTFLEGEYIFIGRQDSGVQDQVYIGNTSGLRGAFVGLNYNASERAKLEVTTSGMGRLIVGNGSTAVYINGSGSINANSLNVGSISATSINSSSHNHNGVYEPVHSHPYLSTSGGTISGNLTVGGVGVKYNNSTAGGTNNAFSFRWNNPDARFAIDNSISATFYTFSDRRLKANIREFNEGLNLINNFNPVWYNPYKNVELISNDVNILDENDIGEDTVGLIADEVEMLAPWLIDGKSPGIQGVKYHLMTPILVKAVQELSNKVDELQSQIDSLS